MQLIRVPLSDLIACLDGCLAQWPRGHVVADEGPMRMKQLTHATAEFAKAYILSSMRHVRKKADPLVVLITHLGYPVDNMSVPQLDELTVEVDDFYLTLVLYLDPMVEAMAKHLDNRSISFATPANSEDLLINIEGDLLAERCRDLTAQLNSFKPPKVSNNVSDLTELEQFDCYAQHLINTAFENLSNTEVRESVKRIFLNAIARV